MLNVGRLHRDGLESTWGEDVRRLAERMHWRWVDTIVWHKVNGGGGRSSPYLVDRHEYVYWLARGAEPYKGFDEARQPYSPATLGRYQRRWKAGGGAVKGKVTKEQDSRQPHPGGAKPGTVFVSSVGAEKGIRHPTPMAPELAEHLIRLSCPPRGVVLDPFLGSGTTAIAARKLGRRCVGVEVDSGYCEEAARRLAQQTLPSTA
jgi:DNA modification methylase